MPGIPCDPPRSSIHETPRLQSIQPIRVGSGTMRGNWPILSGPPLHALHALPLGLPRQEVGRVETLVV